MASSARALDDLATILRAELTQEELPRALLEAAAAAASSSLATLRDFQAVNRSHWEHHGTAVAWECGWAQLAKLHTEAFAYEPRGLTTLGRAYAYALGRPGLSPVILQPREQGHYDEALAFLRSNIELPALSHPSAPKLITWRCLALRAYPRLMTPDGMALSLTNEPLLGRPILLTRHGLSWCRRNDDETTLSRLALLICHEQLHAAFADAARTNPRTRNDGFCHRVEEAVVSVLMLATELVLGEHELTRRALVQFSHLSPYPELTATLARAIRPSEDALGNLAQLGKAAASGNSELTTEVLNRLAARPRRPDTWRSAIAFAGATRF